MATADADVRTTSNTFGRDLLWGAVAGIAAGVVFGLLIQFVLNRMPAIGAMYLQEPSLAVGWAAHVVHSAVFAAVFVTVTSWRALSGYVEAPATGAAVGLVYGGLLWAVNIVFIWPIWLNAVNLPMAPSVPYVAARPLVGHLLWGLLLGLLYPVLRDR